MGFLRIYERDSIHFVTNRCEHEMFFLLPTETINHLITFWLAKAKNEAGSNIEIYAFIFLANHFHIILKDPDGQLPAFMCYFQGNLARAVNLEHHRSGHFWQGKYDDVIVDGEDEFWNRYAYVVGNAVKAGLTATPWQWQGVCSLSLALKDQPVEVTGLKVSEYNEARRFNRKVDKKDFQETHTFALTIPPMLENKTAEERETFIRQLVAGACKKYKQDRLNKPALGMKKILSQTPFDRPRKPAKRPRFKFFSLCKERQKELEDKYRTFVDAYKLCVHQLIEYFKSYRRKKDDESAWVKFAQKAPAIDWPEGSYPPTSHTPVI